MDKHLTIDAPELALSTYPEPEFHHPDQAGQYATPEYTNLLPETQISMSAKERPTENGVVARVHADHQGGKYRLY